MADVFSSKLKCRSGMDDGASYWNHGWNHFADYQKVRDFVKNMEVTNDCAERGVKIIKDFKDIAKDKEQLQFSLQVIAKHCRQVPTISKKILSNQRTVLDQRTSRRRHTDVGAVDIFFFFDLRVTFSFCLG